MTVAGALTAALLAAGPLAGTHVLVVTDGSGRAYSEAIAGLSAAGVAGVERLAVDDVGLPARLQAPSNEPTVWLALGRGVHRVQLEFAAAGDKVALAFPLKPARVLFQGKGWEASGLSDDRLLTETLTLVRAPASRLTVTRRPDRRDRC